MKSKYLILLAMSLGFCALGCSCAKEQPQGESSSSSSMESNEQEENVALESPVISVSQSAVTIGVGDTFTLSASAKNIENAAFLWTVDGDFDNGTVAITQDGNNALVKALKVGQTKLVVSMEYDGHTYYRSVAVTVKESSDVTLVLGDNVGFDKDGYFVRLSMLTTDTDKTSILPLVTAYKNNEIVSLESFAWASEDTDVVTTDGNRFFSENEGKTTVVGSGIVDGKTYTVKVAVEVYRPTIALDESFTVEVEDLKTLGLSSDVRGIGGDVLYNGGVVGSFDEQSKQITLSKDKLPTTAALLGDDLVLTLETSLANYTVTADMYTKIIRSKDELDGMAELAKAASKDQAQWDGYFVLGEDIVYNGLFKSKLADIDSLWTAVGDNWSNGGMYGFKGVIDGKGHKIEGMEIDNNMALGGFVGVLHIDGVIKNISFTNASVGANSSLVCGTGGGSVENIYIQYASIGKGLQKYEGDMSINTHCASFFGFKEPTATANVSNCVVDSTKAVINDSVSIKLAGSEYAAMKNVFVIGGSDEQRAKSNATLAFPAILDFLESTNAQGRYKKFNDTFWSLVGGAPVSQAVYEEIKDKDVHFKERVEYLVSGTEYKFAVDNDYAIVTSDSTLVSISGGVATVSKNALGGESVTFTVTSVFDSNKTDTFTCTLAVSNWGNVVDLTEQGNAFYDITENKVYFAELGESYPALKNTLYFLNDDYTAAAFAEDGGTSTVYAIGKDAVYKLHCTSVTKVISKATDLHYVRRSKTTSSYGVPGCYDGTLTGTFVLIDDIDCTDLVLEDTGKYWENSRGFQGTFDGRGYEIFNLTVGKNGLFGNLSYATVKNVTFTGVNLKAADGTYVGLLANSVFNSTIDNVSMQFDSYVEGATIGATSGLMFYETSYDSTFTNLTLDISKLSGVKYLTESLYEDYDPASDQVKDPPYQSVHKSTYANITVIVKDVNDVPAFAYKMDKNGYTEVDYPDGAFTFQEPKDNEK